MTYSFNLLRSTQTLTLPLLFGVTTIRAYQSVDWSTLDMTLIPKGNVLKQKQPHGVMNVVCGLDSHASFICQNPEFASSFLNTLEPANIPRVVSTTGSGWLFLFIQLARSTQTLTLPLLFGATTMGAYQSVGWSTLDMSPVSNILSNSSLVSDTRGRVPSLELTLGKV